MSLQMLLPEVTEHYRLRGFHQPALDHLSKELTNGAVGPYLSLTGAISFTKRIDSLLGKFSGWTPPSQYPNSEGAKAILGFSFGYRLKSRQAPDEEKRLPGRNNRHLAEISADEKRKHGIPLYVQFEISDALDDYLDTRADFSAPAKDMGTVPAIKYFVEEAKKRGEKLDKVVVVAHRHQMHRCVLILEEDFHIAGVPASKTYEEYDTKEEQPRVICPEMYIVSDFVSMAARIK
jgi:hypothetical protein